MGMFDWVDYRDTLPSGGPTSSDGLFQTKDHDCSLRTLVIEDGQLSEMSGLRIRYTGLLRFYYPEYIAKFVQGRLQWVKLESDYTYDPSDEPDANMCICPCCGQTY